MLDKKEKIEIVINMIVETTTMDGPEGVSKYKELKIPIATDKTASNEDIIAIFSGDFATNGDNNEESRQYKNHWNGMHFWGK